MKTSLVIMAAGIGSRFGGGIKQLEAVGPNGEIIMDYSIHDAIEAGFGKIVFIIRRDIEADFRTVIGNRIEAFCAKHNVEVCYAFQSLDALPEGIEVPEGRSKPWGTGQAVLCVKDIVREPFAVINADDYYGKEAFFELQSFLSNMTEEKPYDYCMAGFILKNTLSDNGGVTRGICKVGSGGNLMDIEETKNIVKTPEGAAVLKSENPTALEVIDADSYVSMNMWGLSPKFIDLLEEGFRDFFNDPKFDPLTSEYLIPIYIGQLLQEKKISVRVLSTNDKWFGVTYKEDKPVVVESFRRLIEAGVYREDLFGDL